MKVFELSLLTTLNGSKICKKGGGNQTAPVNIKDLDFYTLDTQLTRLLARNLGKVLTWSGGRKGHREEETTLGERKRGNRDLYEKIGE